jgi:hypothetical protein
MAAADLDDTTRCPVATWCESCNRTEDLYVVTADSGMGGVFCMTLCGECCERPLPQFGVLEATTRVAEHCGHLGIDLDQMADAVVTARRAADVAESGGA